MSHPQRHKPDWLKVRLPQGPGWARIDRYHREQGLHSVCRSAACPNQGECWSRGTATFMILGNLCTRACAFCNVRAGAPAPPDPDEPARVAQAIGELDLRHAVVTSVTRDDLDDGGASHFACLVHEVRDRAPHCRIELLIPDLGGNLDALELILAAAPDVLGHNIETIPRLYPQVRQGAHYQRSLAILAAIHQRAPHIPTKSGLMLGLGETQEEILAVLADLRQVGCALLTLGQYLAPTRRHHPVVRYPHPDEFAHLRRQALALGFAHVEAGPLVRSSYHAQQQFEEATDVHRLPNPA
ncbi:lipoyl synthase [Geoalkalibacter halelectricus]|uniref:Lipoyl synthase n=1 Tax=Geoalkalibacter halelectricus TaxID=2847045 RepID=A0ABY5ZS08_9BACT|nr:lipoyl synthase [Geoalkalibacter halelectricus]MDO3377622.1 lipoyl synthase [Geoalkalibacter halelectricus]UWZ81413.1 lipoyl synthase [Geoalkalibacter halelectricus]